MRAILTDSQHLKSMSEKAKKSTIDQQYVSTPNSIGNEDYLYSISIITS